MLNKYFTKNNNKMGVFDSINNIPSKLITIGSFVHSVWMIGVVYVLLAIVPVGCANIIPPDGGLKDSLPPVLLQAIPMQATKNFTAQRIVLNFDEYVELKSIQENLLVSPLPKSTPVVDFKLKTVTIKLRDSLLPNTTYSLNFGNGIVDVNEGNPLKGFTYVFSTGNYMDSCKISGNVKLAEKGTIDTTLIAALYSNLNDTAVRKIRPTYIARVNGKGDFSFDHLPRKSYNLFVFPNDYSKKYDDSTKMFAFADSSIIASTNPTSVKLLAFEETKKKDKKPTASKPDKKKLSYTNSLESNRQDLLNNYLTLQFSNKLRKADSTAIRITDTLYNTISTSTVTIDTALSRIIIFNPWKAGENYKLIVAKTAATDTFNNNLDKSDTIKFVVKKKEEYGSLKVRIGNIDLEKNPVIQFYSNDNLVESKTLTRKDISFKLFHPGEYEVRILFDENKNGVWDAGNYKQHLQPERVETLKAKIQVKANWENESEIVL